MNRLLMITALSVADIWSAMENWYRGSFINSALKWFEALLSSVTSVSYENFQLETTAERTLRSLILGFAIGFLVAAGMTFYVKKVQGGFVRALLKNQCLSPQKGMTLKQLGFFSSISVRKELSRGLALRKIVFPVLETDEETPNQELDFSTTRFYIPEDLRYRAEVKYAAKGSELTLLIITLVLVLIATVVISRYLPSILSVLDRLLSLF